MFKKYGHRKSRLDKDKGSWANFIWWEAKDQSGRKYKAMLLFKHDVYFVDHTDVVEKFKMEFS